MVWGVHLHSAIINAHTQGTTAVSAVAVAAVAAATASVTAPDSSSLGNMVSSLADNLCHWFGALGIPIFFIICSLPVVFCVGGCLACVWFRCVDADKRAGVLALLSRGRSEPISAEEVPCLSTDLDADIDSARGALGDSAATTVVNTSDLVVMTLNLQYFSSYPKDQALGQYRLSQVLTQDTQGGRPDIICIQEGLHSKNVLSVLGYELCVCSAREKLAQSVYDMVYGDEAALKACDAETHSHFLCNQIYKRKDSEWKVADSGAIQISSDMNLTGGGGRTTGKLAMRSMVWVQLRKRDNTPCAYVMCTHITGGRFEDQYFVQQMAEERKLQLNRIISFFNKRRTSEDDVGIVVGDFNATSVYTNTGAMHDYYKACIAASPGVQADAAQRNVRAEGELERHFEDYMVSPFTAISAHGWTFAYDRQQVNYTSGFGHCIDHMAMSRPLQVHSTEVIHFTNQKFGNKPKDAEIVLTDHNSVKCVFKIAPKEATHTYVFRTEYDFLQHLQKYKALVHISGFGSKQQFLNVDEAVAKVAHILFECDRSMDKLYGKGNWAACFGGDPANEAKPDVGVLVQQLQEKYQLHIIAVQCEFVEKEWGGVDKHVDAVYYYPTEYQKDGKTIAWGGESMGRLVGTTRILLEVNPLSGLPMYWVACGGGDISAGELRAAYGRGLPILSIPQRARYPQDPGMICGPCPQFWESLPESETEPIEVQDFRKRKGGAA